MPKYNYNDDNDFNDFVAEFDPLNTDRQARRKRKVKAQHKPKKSQDRIISEIADTVGIETNFAISYKPAKHEAIWLYESLQTFFQQDFITDVLSLVKGGKEANVYRCKADPATTGHDYLAVKVYRPRMFRNLRNDKMYRDGRQVLTESGRPIDARDVRTIRALGKNTAYGQQVAHTSWLMHEFNAMRALHSAGANVPEPVAAGTNGILMSYIGDDIMPAPPLHSVQLESDEVQPLFETTLHNIEVMLQHGWIHGDLSEYNILYWAGEITFIDLPQVVEVNTNLHAEAILLRDITRVCEYFNQYGINAYPEEILYNLWGDYGVINNYEVE